MKADRIDYNVCESAVSDRRIFNGFYEIMVCRRQISDVSFVHSEGSDRCSSQNRNDLSYYGAVKVDCYFAFNNV